MDQEEKRFYAYEIHRYGDMPITVAPIDREWMDTSDQRFAYRCLPLNIANQAGWVIDNPVGFTAVWDGGRSLHNLEIYFDSAAGEQDVFTGFGNNVITVAALTPSGANTPMGSLSRPRDPRITSHFGSGVVTFSIPYLFRTPPAVNLWVKGPCNWIKDGAQPLEGIVETDWLPATFTMNWKLTRPNYPVRFERGEPVCMLVPVARGLAESLEPVCSPLQSRPELNEQYQEWLRSRSEFNLGLQARRPDVVRVGWQRDYVKGVMPGGTRATEHQTRLALKEFIRLEDVRSERVAREVHPPQAAPPERHD